MTVSRQACRACGDSRWQGLESIDFDHQHTLYAADDAQLRAALTVAVRQHTSGYQMQRCGRCGLEAADPLVNPGSDWYGLAYGALSLYPTHRWEFDRSISILNGSHRKLARTATALGALSSCSDRDIACTPPLVRVFNVRSFHQRLGLS